MTQRVDAAIDVLRAEETQVGEEIRTIKAQAKAQVKPKEAELNRIRKALTALGANGNGTTARKLKPAATTKDVAQWMAAILNQEGPLAVDTLRAKVGELATEQGMGHHGLALRIKQALSLKHFDNQDGTVSLRQA